MNEALEIQELNASALRILGIEDQKSVLGKRISALLDPAPFSQVAETKENLIELNLFLEEYSKHISLNVIYDPASNIIIAIMRDITESETAREIKEARDRRTIEVTDKVIEKQMATVQVIASLLGETTAETKIALSKLKETLRNE